MKEGDKKTVVQFAFFPTKVEGRTIWWKNYVQHYEYVKYLHSVTIRIELTGDCDHITNYDHMWIKTERTLM